MSVTIEFETPDALLRRLKLGREELCQRLLTSLILQGPYPRWNTRSTPSPSGLQFLRRLYERHFDGRWPGDEALFVDELELRPRHDAERGGAPDYAILWSDRVWIVELKTEKGSHRKEQIPGYFELARHHHPEAAVDVLYLTPPMDAPYDPGVAWGRYAHVTWSELADLIRVTWPAGRHSTEQAVVDGLIDAIDHLDLTPSAWREASYGIVRAALETTPHEAQEADDLAVAKEIAAATADDGRQRAIDVEADDLEDLLGLRLELREALASAPADSPLRRVVPWLWRWESTGQPLSEGGRRRGVELRVSRYGDPQY